MKPGGPGDSMPRTSQRSEPGCRRRFVAAAVGLLLWPCSPILAQPGGNDVLQCGLTRDAPTIDGDLSDHCWRLAGQAVDFLELSEEQTTRAGKQTVVYALWDRETLFLGARCEQKSPDQIVRVAGRQAYENDCVEFFVLPEGARAFHQFSVDTLPGNLYEGHAGTGGPGSGARSAARIGRDGWSIELAVPFAAFGRSLAAGEHWSLNMGREDGEARTLSIWAPSSRFQDISRFGLLRFVSRVPEDRRVASHVGVLDQVVSNPDFAPGPDGLPRGWTVSRPHTRVGEITFQSGQWELVCRGVRRSWPSSRCVFGPGEATGSACVPAARTGPGWSSSFRSGKRTGHRRPN